MVSQCGMFALYKPHHESTPKGTPWNFDPKWPNLLLNWALQTFNGKLQPNGYR